MRERISAIQKTVEHLAKVPAEHIESVIVIEKFGERTVWEGVVEKFVLLGHPVASRAYGWSVGKDSSATYKAVLEIPPVDSPNTAVRATYLSFLLQHAGATARPEEARFIRCVEGREVPIHEHEFLWLKLLRLNSYQVLQSLLSQARSISAPLQNTTLVQFPECWKRLSKRFEDGHAAGVIDLYRLALSLMSSTQLYEFARALQVLRGRFPDIRFAMIYLVHSLAATAGEPRSRQWVHEQDEADGVTSSASCIYLGCGDPFGDRYRRSNEDAASNAASLYHLLHQDDGTQEAGVDTKDVTDLEREQLRYDGGAGSDYWDAE